jgi:hypothetical protein
VTPLVIRAAHGHIYCRSSYRRAASAISLSVMSRSAGLPTTGLLRNGMSLQQAEAAASSAQIETLVFSDLQEGFSRSRVGRI